MIHYFLQKYHYINYDHQIKKEKEKERNQPSELHGEEHHVDREFPFQASSDQSNRTMRKSITRKTKNTTNQIFKTKFQP